MLRERWGAISSIDHNTNRGYHQHKKHRIVVCEGCLNAHAEARWIERNPGKPLSEYKRRRKSI
jgi:predicted metal-binding protein